MNAELGWGRRYLMCPPAHFDVIYAINPWMNVSIPVDREVAQRQWDALVATYRGAGAAIGLLEPQPGLPEGLVEMVLLVVQFVLLRHVHHYSRYWSSISVQLMRTVPPTGRLPAIESAGASGWTTHGVSERPRRT